MASYKQFFILLLLTIFPLSGRCDSRKTMTIGNDFIQKTFLLSGGKVYPFSYRNRRIDSDAVLPFSDTRGESEEFVIALDPSHAIKASDLTCSKIQRIREKGHETVLFRFAPYVCRGVRWMVTLEYDVEKGDPSCLKKSVYIKVPRDQWRHSGIDYIDLFHFSVEKAAHCWTLPKMQDGAEGVNGYYLSLGQPFYVNGMFWGCEFPATDNKIERGTAHVRYYLGKNMQQLSEDHRLTADGTFVTWKGVAGATESVGDIDVIQNGFFAYIRKIAVPSRLRVQYNSWYDFRLDINRDNILRSFKEIEKNLTQNGEPPLDSYVIDDGWNAYGPWGKDNRTHFWEFNRKFPNGLEEPSQYASSVASRLGLWLGPRGGYDFNAEFAKMLERYGNGVYNVRSNDIVTGDRIYLKKLQDFFIKCQRLYHINYWKLDGFMHTPPQPDPRNRYISGGYRGLYYVTEHWERWIRVFNAMRRQNPDLWLNLTSYVNPSPWFLQWGNSVWLQNSGDLGRTDTGLPKDVDKMLTYRDGRYYDFIRTRQFQFPIDRLYNHDPIFGKANSGLTASSLSDDDFREYLYMMTTRGNSFWELYYSTSLFDRAKWMVNARALDWLRRDHRILVHAKMFGGNPEKGNVYGYSSWDGGDGIVSVRNPSPSEGDYDLVLDDRLGMEKSDRLLYRTAVLSANGQPGDTVPARFSYGDTLHLHMAPGEARIWRFSASRDTAAPVPVFAKAEDDSRILVTFDEPVRLAPHATFAVTRRGQRQCRLPSPSGAVSLLADRQTVEIPFRPEGSSRADSLLVRFGGIEDLSGNKLDRAVPVAYYSKDVVYDSRGKGSERLPAAYGTHSDFSVLCSLKGLPAETRTLFSIGTDVYVRELKSGRILFRARGLEAESNASVRDGKVHAVAAVRERNGMLKIYIDGRVDAAAYSPKIVLPEIHPGTIGMDRTSVGHLLLLDRALSYDECLRCGV